MINNGIKGLLMIVVLGTSVSGAGRSYLFYTGSLHAVATSNPADDRLIESDPLVDARTIYHGNYSPTTGIIRGMHAETIVYVKNGRLFKVGARKDRGTGLVPVQLSSESDPGMCAIEETASDFSDHRKSQIIYSLPGPDGLCRYPNKSDNIFRMVTLGMTANDPPLPVKADLRLFPLPLHDASTGRIIRWITQDGDNNIQTGFTQYDATFNNPFSILSGGTDSSLNYVSVIQSIAILTLDGAMRSYNWRTHSLSPVRHVVHSSNDLGGMVGDGSYVYFTERDGNKGIWRMPLDGSGQAVQLVSEANARDGLIREPSLTKTHVIYTVVQEAEEQLKAVPRKGGTAKTLLSRPLGSGYPALLGSGIGRGNVVRYWYWNWNNLVPVVGLMTDDGIIMKELPSTDLIWSYGSDSGLLGEFVKLGDHSSDQLLLIAEGVQANGIFAGATVKVLDALKGTTLRTLGTVPQDIKSFHDGFDFGNAVLVGGSTLNPGNADIFYFDLSKSNSMRRLTNTPSVIERTL
jgi:hypothetical protein